jgi:hypothetical protein
MLYILCDLMLKKCGKKKGKSRKTRKTRSRK